MLTRSLFIWFVIVIAVGCSPNGSNEQEPVSSKAEIAEPVSEKSIDWGFQIAYQRGIETVNWAIPAVSMLRMRDANFSLGGGYNTVYYMSHPPTPQAEAMTPNNQTPYATIHMTTEHGPVVLNIPPASARTAIFGSATDVWQEPVADIGPAGSDQGSRPDTKARYPMAFSLCP